MRVLIYKRTHNGDPDRLGRFGIHDCMGSVRKHEFDAVIGVGGIGPEAQANGIGGQINWIGVGVHKAPLRGGRGPIITFDHFVEYGIDGPDFRSVAPQLANQIYEGRVRHQIVDADDEEVKLILSMAEDAPPSGGRVQQRRPKGEAKWMSETTEILTVSFM